MVIIQTFIIAITALLGMTVITNAIKEVMVEKEKTKQSELLLSIEMTKKYSPEDIEYIAKLKQGWLSGLFGLYSGKYSE